MPVHYPSEFSLDKASSRYYGYMDLLRSKWLLWDQKIKSGKAVIVESGVEFRLTENAQVSIGSHTVISSQTFIHMTKPEPNLDIGEQVGIGRGCQIYVKKKVVIGDYTRIGTFVIIRDCIHEPFASAHEKIIETKSRMEPVIIGKNVWIGSFSSIFPGVTIGEGSVISTYALVTKDVPPFTVVAGQPARVVKYRSEDSSQVAGGL